MLQAMAQEDSGQVSVAAVNGPQLTVVSGCRAVVKKARWGPSTAARNKWEAAVPLRLDVEAPVDLSAEASGRLIVVRYL